MMKESTYGWYPAAHDVYRNAARFHNNPYHLQCLYNFQNSKYYSGQVAPPSPTICLGLKNPPPPDWRPSPPTKYRSKSVSYGKIDRAQSDPCLIISPAPRMKATPIPTPTQAWATAALTEETQITVPPAAPSYARPTKRTIASARPRCPSIQRPCQKPETVDLDWSAFRHYKPAMTHRLVNRVKSAPVHKTRPRVSFRRPASSAAPVRPVQDVRAQTAPSRPPNDIPNIADLKLDDDEGKDDKDDTDDDVTMKDDDDVSSRDEYEEQLNTYGWRAEVHGDPYNLKKLSKRMPYVVTCDEPEIPPDPPTGHMENWQTFFLNTIPKRPAAYTIHKEWISEIIHSKRMELQKKQGVNYNYKKYAFVY